MCRAGDRGTVRTAALEHYELVSPLELLEDRIAQKPLILSSSSLYSMASPPSLHFPEGGVYLGS